MDDGYARISLFGWPDRQSAVPEAGTLCAVGVPTDHGNVISRGAAHGPGAIRRASLSLAAPPLEGTDIGDVDRSDGPDPETFMDRIADVTRGLLERGLCPLILGGDHSITYAPVSVLQRSRSLCLIWFDAHTDFSPWSGQSSHNHKQVLRRISKLEGVSRIVQIGYRGITGGNERNLGADSAVVTTACARTLDEEALLALVPGDLPCYISIDIDVVDPFRAPGTSAPVPDGLLPKQVRSMLQSLVRHREIVGADLVEVNPALDRDSATSLVAADLLQGMAESWGHQRALREAGKAWAARRSARPGDPAVEASAADPALCGGNCMSTANRLKPAATQSREIPVYELEEFQRLLAGSPDLLSEHPCVVRGFTEQWAASRSWTSLEKLTEAFGSLPVTAGAPQFITHKHSTMCQVKTDFGTYLSYVQNPDRLEELFDGKWSKGDASVLRELDLPLYCGNLRLVRHSREKILSEIEPLVPDPMEHLNDDIPYYYRSGNHVWLYVSLAGALTPLHQDNNAVIAYLAQLQGHKEAILYSPDDKPHYWNRELGYMDPLCPNDDEFPTWREARPWTASLNPGELLIWGSNWAHHVVTLSNSITVSFDIVNRFNLDAYTRSSEWRGELGRFARKNADLIRSRIPDPRVHDALDNGSEAELGREVMICVLRDALAAPLTERSRRVKSEMLQILEEHA